MMSASNPQSLQKTTLLNHASQNLLTRPYSPQFCAFVSPGSEALAKGAHGTSVNPWRWVHTCKLVTCEFSGEWWCLAALRSCCNGLERKQSLNDAQTDIKTALVCSPWQYKDQIKCKFVIDTDSAFVASKQRVNLPTVALDCQPLFRQQNCEWGIKEWWKSILVYRNLLSGFC